MRRRILFAIGGTLLVMLIIISAASSTLLRDAYANLERRYVERDVQRVLGYLSRQTTSLGRTVDGYSTWTALVEFIHRPSTAFAQVNFSDDAAATLRIDAALVLGNDGNLIF